MKIFFSGAYTDDKRLLSFYKRIYDYIVKLGYVHNDDDIIGHTYENFKSVVFQEKDSDFNKHYLKKIKNIASADICVFEVSNHSLGVGFLIQKALDSGKPVLALYCQDNVPIFLSGLEDERFALKQYSDETLEKTLKEGLDMVRERRDKRFNFFISPKLLEYLESASGKDGVTKSRFIRNLIVRHVQKRKENIDEDDM